MDVEFRNDELRFYFVPEDDRGGDLRLCEFHALDTGSTGLKKDRKIGTTKAHKRQAEEIAKKINGALALGSFQL